MKFIMPTIMGAIIGYITNWLAIKMLFRPYEEKRILGIKLPFTPGLIPKEKSRIARSVGDAIGTHLLSKETMVEALCSEKMNEHLNTWVDQKMDGLIACEDSPIQNINKYFNKEVIDLNNIKSILNEKIFAKINEEEIKNHISSIIFNNLCIQLKSKPENLMKDLDLNKCIHILKCKIDDIKSSEDFNYGLSLMVKKKIDELSSRSNTLEDILPESLKVYGKMYVYEHRSEISSIVKESIKSPEMEYKIKHAIAQGISSNVNPLVAMFLTPDNLYSKFISFTEDYLDKDSSQKDLCSFINGILDKLLQTDIGYMINSISEKDKMYIINSFTSSLLNNIIDDEVVDKSLYLLIKNIENKESIDEIIRTFDSNYEEKLKIFIDKKLDKILSGEDFKNSIASLISKVVDSYAKKSMKELLNGYEEKIRLMTKSFVENMYNRFIENEAVEIIEILNIKKIVEDNINAFDVAFAEKIILEIASKELSAITWFGALLGGLIGILTPLISLIY